ncbi:hypothetical protein ACJX0J_028825, partial [Zea mays]
RLIWIDSTITQPEFSSYNSTTWYIMRFWTNLSAYHNFSKAKRFFIFSSFWKHELHGYGGGYIDLLTNVGAELNHKQRKNTFTSLDKHWMYDFLACTGIQKRLLVQSIKNTIYPFFTMFVHIVFHGTKHACAFEALAQEDTQYKKPTILALIYV